MATTDGTRQPDAGNPAATSHISGGTRFKTGGYGIYSDSDEEGGSNMVGGHEAYSDLSEEGEEDDDEVTPARVSGPFTATSFQTPIPESWLSEDTYESE